MNWHEMFSGKKFITDLGSGQPAEINEGNEPVGRYAVWSPLGEKNHQIVEVSSNIDELKAKYGISDHMICTLAE